MTRPCLCAPFAIFCGLLLLGTAGAMSAQQVTERPAPPVGNTSLIVPADVPLRIEVTGTIPLKVGHPWHGRLTEPVYGPDRLLLPAGSAVEGVIAETPAEDRHTRTQAKLDGDFTPLRDPVLRVTRVVLPTGAVLPVNAEGDMRNAASISLGLQPAHTSIAGKLKGMVHAQIQQVRDTVHEPHKRDRIQQLLYHQLPYHPQRVWAGTGFDAVLTQPVPVPLEGASPEMPHTTDVELTSGTLRGRLIAGISSATAKKGDAVSAVLNLPFCNRQGAVMLPAGTQLQGTVLQARPARSFGRNGRLRFSFRSVVPPSAADAAASSRHIEGSLSSIQALDGQNVALDAEGGARAQPDKGRFLAPLVLGVMAVASQDEDGGIARQGVTSNGFGLPARILAMAFASRNLSTAFASYSFSKSIYRRYIARGHEVTFPRHTELSIELSRH